MKKSILTITLALISVVSFAQNINVKSYNQKGGVIAGNVQVLNVGDNGKIPDSTKHVKSAKVTKPLPAVKKDTVKVDPNLHINITKQMAVLMLPGLEAAYSGVARAKNISAEDADDARRVSSYFLDLIYKKWPDLIPAQPANQ